MMRNVTINVTNDPKSEKPRLFVTYDSGYSEYFGCDNGQQISWMLGEHVVSNSGPSEIDQYTPNMTYKVYCTENGEKTVSDPIEVVLGSAFWSPPEPEVSIYTTQFVNNGQIVPGVANRLTVNECYGVVNWSRFGQPFSTESSIPCDIILL